MVVRRKIQQVIHDMRAYLAYSGGGFDALLQAALVKVRWWSPHLRLSTASALRGTTGS